MFIYIIIIIYSLSWAFRYVRWYRHITPNGRFDLSGTKKLKDQSQAVTFGRNRKQTISWFLLLKHITPISFCGDTKCFNNKNRKEKNKEGLPWVGWEKLILCSKSQNYKMIQLTNVKMKHLRKETFRRVGDIRCLRTQNIIPCWKTEKHTGTSFDRNGINSIELCINIIQVWIHTKKDEFRVDWFFGFDYILLIWPYHRTHVNIN